MRFEQLVEAKTIIDARYEEMDPAVEFYGASKNPDFIPKSKGFHFTYHEGNLVLNSSANEIYDIRYLGIGGEKIATRMWNQFGGKVDFASSTITISKESAGNGMRQRDVFHLKTAKKAFKELKKFGVTDDFKIKGWSLGAMTVGKFMDMEDVDEKIKSSNVNTSLVLYHGTSAKRWEEIEAKGLRPGMTEEAYVDLIKGYSEHNVYLAITAKTADFYGKRQAKKDDSDSYYVLEVRVPDPSKLLPDDHFAHSLHKNTDGNGSTIASDLIKLSVETNGSLAYRGVILPSFITVKAKKKAG